jgi:hypothetical protein
MGDQPVWECPSGDWLQDDEKKRFLRLEEGSRSIQGNQAGLEVIVGAKWHRAAQTECGGFFPPEFDFCPFCGKELASGKFESDPWIPPFGGGGGLRLAAGAMDPSSIPNQKKEVGEDNKPKRWVDQDKDLFPLPRPRGDYEFLVAPLGAKFPVLVAFDRTTGLVDYFSPASEKWISLTPASGRRVGESRLPNWSWSAGFTRKSPRPGFAAPTDAGPVWIGIDWASGAIKPVFGLGECIGGVACLGDRLFVPVLVEGVAAIHGFDLKTYQWVQFGESASGWAPQDDRESRYFSVPVVDEGRNLIHWVGIHGLITLDVSNPNCSLRPWKADSPCRAVPQLGPPCRDAVGHYWQICYDDRDEAFRYYKLIGDEGDREDVDGARFSSGISCFSKSYDLWEAPWEKVDTHRRDKRNRVRTPLLCLDEKSKTTITAVFASPEVPLQIVEDRDRSYPTELVIESPDNLPIELRTLNSLQIRTPWELRLFVYRDRLYVYSVEEAACHMWRVK